MADPHSLPTLHRPVLDEKIMLPSLDPGLPIPTPPHKPAFKPFMRSSPCSAYERRQEFAPSSNESIPPVMTENNWKAIRAGGYQGPKPQTFDYDRCYDELLTKIAYRYPHPGGPSKRVGCVGGTWRHMKEAVGYGPGRLMWVDGVIGMYDESRLNDIKPVSAGCLRASNSHIGMQQLPSISDGRKCPRMMMNGHEEIPWYAMNMPQPLGPNLQKPGSCSDEGKYKGFYSMSQTYA